MIQVIVPFYNCLPWIARCLYSLERQQGCQYRVFVADDCSTDGSSDVARALCASYGYWYYRNETNIKCPHNIVNAITMAGPDPEAIIYILDGDDHLTHEHSLKYIQDQYDNDPNLWLAYGRYQPVPYDGGCQPAGLYPDRVIRGRSFRHYPTNMFNHPLTFKTWLYDRLERADFCDKNGNWFLTGYDRVLMYPLLEMATRDDRVFWKCLDEVTYSYNSINMNSEAVLQLPTDNADDIYHYKVKDVAWRADSL